MCLCVYVRMCVSQDEGQKMTTSRFVHLLIRGLHNNIDEMWISAQPYLLATYLAQYAPGISRQVGRLVGPHRVRAIREDGNPFDLKVKCCVVLSVL